MAAVVIYKKYANRRIYDTQSSRYVTLDELADAIRQGRQVQVIDAKTKDDVTAFVLTQIVLEQAKRKNILLPSPVLHLIIRYGDNVLLDFFETYLQQIVHNYIQYKKSVDDQFQRWLDLGMGLTSRNPEEAPDLNPFAAFFGRSSPTSSDDDG